MFKLISCWKSFDINSFVEQNKKYFKTANTTVSNYSIHTERNIKKNYLHSCISPLKNMGTMGSSLNLMSVILLRVDVLKQTHAIINMDNDNMTCIINNN